MTINERIADERTDATLRALDEICVEMENKVRDLACEAEANKAEAEVWKMEVHRLEGEIKKMERDIEALVQNKKLNDMNREYNDAMIRQLHGCGECTNCCSEKCMPVTEIKRCENFVGKGMEETIRQSPAVTSSFARERLEAEAESKWNDDDIFEDEEEEDDK